MKKSLLIVEDDRWFAEVCADALDTICSVRIVHDSQAAIEAVDDHIPDVVLLDLMMPGGNALAFLQEFRSYSDTRTTPVILCTSARLLPDEMAGLQAFAPITYQNKATLTPQLLAGTVAKQLAVAGTKK